MHKSISEYYNQHYRYDLPENKKPGEAVNSLFERVERNDQEALEEVLKILSSNTFYLVLRRLSDCGNVIVENVDDVLQNVRLEVIKAAFRGFSERVTQDGFYGYLLGMTEKCIKNYRKRLENKNTKEQYDTKNCSVLDAMETAGRKERSDNPEDMVVMRNQQRDGDDIIHFYLTALRGTEEKPYKVLAYCYAVLLPQLFKKSCNSRFKRKIGTISSRNGRPPFSYYNEEKNCLEGEIARKSAILINWAMGAMEGQRVEELDKEFLELYKEEPLNEEEFLWGKPYSKNMEKIEHNKPIKFLVITKEFSQNAIKNWPIRVAERLRDETGRLVQKDRGFCKKSVRIVEDMICREEKICMRQ